MRRYLTTYLSGDVDRAHSLVGDDFVFQAPLVESTATKEAFFAGIEHKLALIRAHRILRMWADGDSVFTVYEIDVETPAGAASMLMHEWHTVRQGRIASTVMIFDTQAPAAQLMRQALASPHG